MCMIMVGANKGIMRMTREYIFLCKTLDIPWYSYYKNRYGKRLF